MKDLLILVPIIGLIAGFIVHNQQEYMAEVWTIDNCVMEKWQNWEDVRGVMPTQAEEKTFREECWADMGATLNQG